MDGYNHLKKIFNMSEKTKDKTVPRWYAEIKSNCSLDRVFSNAIKNPNSQLVKALLYCQFKIPVNNNYNNIVDIFRVILKSNADKERVPTHYLNPSLSSRNTPRVTLRPTERTGPALLDAIHIEIENWWAERTESYDVREYRRQRSTEAPELPLSDILDAIVIDLEEGNDLSRLEEYIEEESKDEDDNAYYEADNTDYGDEEYLDTIDQDYGYDQPETIITILNRLRTILRNQNEETVAVQQFLATKNTNLRSVIDHISETL